MKYRITVSFLIDEEDPEMAEVELESQLADMVNISSTTIREFEILEVDELDEEDI